jgi:hypothetical protein
MVKSKGKKQRRAPTTAAASGDQSYSAVIRAYYILHCGIGDPTGTMKTKNYTLEIT